MTSPGRPAVPAVRYAERLAAARDILHTEGLAALLVGVGPDLRYLTGYVAMPLERLTMLVVPADGPFTIVVPRLELDPARRSPAVVTGAVATATWEETDDPFAIVARLALDGVGSAGAAGRGGAAIGARLAVSDRLWASHLLRLQATLPGASFAAASGVMRQLRIVKDADEAALLRIAARAADRVVAQIAAGRLVGRAEADVSREVRERLLAEGHELAEFAIVASGPNSASPHHEASDRVIGAGDPIVLDIGGALDGYGSDVTRTLWVTGGDAGHGPDAEFRHLYDVVRRAHSEASHGVWPGAIAEGIDALARGVIAEAGYGPNFIHRLGHGIGLEGHEDPYLVAGNREPLRVGMAFSIEPGIYLEGRYGARLEDIVLCATDGPDFLNEAPRELHVVSGL